MTYADSLPTGPAPRHSWRSFGRRGLLNQAACLAIAALIHLLSSSEQASFVVTWIYSACIGTSCWFLIDGGRVLRARALPWRSATDAPTASPWREPVALIALILVGTLIGFSVGSSLADWLTGYTTPSLLQNLSSVTISLIVAVVATYYFYSTEKLNQQRTAIEAARRLATEHQLKLLESQLEPHMRFNTLPTCAC